MPLPAIDPGRVIYGTTDVRDVHKGSSLSLQRAMTFITLLVCLLFLSFVLALQASRDYR